jgi:ABC-type nitrate/sulfonate/bicarbonate transport system substrate-binding protein
MSKLKSALLIALAALTLAGSVQVIRAEAPAQASPDTLTIGVDPWPGFGILYIAESGGFFQQQGIDVIAFQQQSIDADPDRIQRFVQALSAAQVWWAANPEEGNALVGERIALTSDEMRDRMTLVRLYSASENSAAMDPTYRESASAFVSGKLTVDIFMETGLIKEAVDVQTLLDPSFVQSLQQSVR